jgi:hypothetical protein
MNSHPHTALVTRLVYEAPLECDHDVNGAVDAREVSAQVDSYGVDR